jgi:hypothetical protein
LALRLCGLTALPESIGHLSNLTSLDFRNNKLTTLPRAMRRLSRLRSLDISENEFPAFPSDIFNLASLHVLRLSYVWVDTIVAAADEFASRYEPESDDQSQHIAANMLRDDYLCHWLICDRPLTEFSRIDLPAMTQSLHQHAQRIQSKAAEVT